MPSSLGTPSPQRHGCEERRGGGGEGEGREGGQVGGRMGGRKEERERGEEDDTNLPTQYTNSCYLPVNVVDGNGLQLFCTVQVCQNESVSCVVSV